jgi:hypothetical protein
MSEPIYSPELLGNVAQQNYLNFSSENDASHALGVLDFLKFQKKDVSHIAGIPQNQFRTIKDLPPAVLRRFIEIGNICQLVAGYFGGNPEKTYLWFTLPNMMLGNIPPREMIRLGRYQKLHSFVVDALGGYAA